MVHFLILLPPLLVVAASCASPRDHLPAIAEIYKDAALNETRNPVVVIHGVLGSRIHQKSTGKSVWGAFDGDYADPSTAEGSRAMASPIEIPGPCTEFDPANEDVVATGPLETMKLSVLFNIISVDVYKNIIRTLGAGGYRDPMFVDSLAPKYAHDHFTCYSFWYDWRRDNVTNAIQLGRFLRRTRKAITSTAEQRIVQLRAEGDAAGVTRADNLRAWLDRGFRFDIVAHSMGGLVARYYLRYGEQDLPADGSDPEVTWAGAEEIDRLVMVGTPNLGCMVALRRLTLGHQPSIFMPYYDQAILGSMPSIYQILPRVRHGVVIDGEGESIDIDLLDAKVWEDNAWGLLDPRVASTIGWLVPNTTDASARRDKVIRYLRWCLNRARRFHRAMDQRAAKICPAEIHLFAADSEPTLSRTVVGNVDDRWVPTYPETSATTLFGDGSVPRYSAIGDERQGGEFSFGLKSNIPFTNETFLSDDHIGLTRNPHFADNILHLLLEKAPRRRR